LIKSPADVCFKYCTIAGEGGYGANKPLFSDKERLIKMSKKLYIGNLSYKVTEVDLKKKFGEIGECISVKIVIDKFSGNPTGFAFVEMATEEDARLAIKKLNRTAMYGRAIIVDEAKPKGGRKNSRRPGFRRRGRF